MLNERCGGSATFEVLNLGIPHLTSAQIVALFEHEGVPLAPDFVTFYEGVNDAAGTQERIAAGGAKRHPSALRAFARALRQRLMMVELAHDIAARKLEKRGAEYISDTARARREQFVENLEALRQATRRTNATLVVANQQAKSTLHDRESIRGVRYADEVREIRDLLAQRGFLYAPEALLLVHAELMDGEARWSAAHEVPFVDLIHALDQRRDVLVSWVHLLPEGNRIIADELAAPILARACPTHH